MRTTLTLDDDVHALLEQAARRERRPVREIVNDALRRALVTQRASTAFRVSVHHSALCPGIDPDRMNQLADELEDEALVERLSR